MSAAPHHEEPEPRTAAKTARVLVVDDDRGSRTSLSALLQDAGYEVRSAADGFKALGVLEVWPCELVLTDLRMPNMTGLELLKKAKTQHPDLSCVVMTAFASVETAVSAMKAGADDYLTKPLNFDAVEIVLERVLERRTMKRELRRLKQRDISSKAIVGTSPSIKQVLQLIEQVAPTRATVLLTGESGTGKELLARLLHDRSGRASRPFIRVHCAALAETLLESELFGHERGAFTGAMAQRAGRFEQADGGTLFLDEMGEISPTTQVKLLRFLQQREFERVGGNKTLRVDVRIVAATNRNLLDDVKNNRFREDLFFRLNVINVEAPPLRARRGDIPLLVRHFVTTYSEENGKPIDDVAGEAMGALEQHDWPGNVRELENIVERAVVLCDSGTIERRHLPSQLGNGTARLDGLTVPGSTLAELERFAILKTHEATGGSSKETARILGISRRKVQYKLAEYQEP